jgi:hypothetical protein
MGGNIIHKNYKILIFDANMLFNRCWRREIFLLYPVGMILLLCFNPLLTLI